LDILSVSQAVSLYASLTSKFGQLSRRVTLQLIRSPTSKDEPRKRRYRACYKNAGDDLPD
jgi:hypothetical protein